MKALIFLAIFSLTGCAAVAVNSDDIVERTAFVLGVSPKSLRISGRRDSGVRTDYVATTSSGARYACYVTGTYSITGRIVSDAICSKGGATGGNRKVSPSAAPCNALLKAAGKCN